ncbi:tRNA pseudouridine(38-40) synthase TruA [Fusibacter sp. JL298sf-3]
MQNYKGIVHYEGTKYKGWQRLKQSGDTVQGKIEETLSRLLNETVAINGSGRTDAGVHARGQVFNFQTAHAVAPEWLLQQVNHYLPEDIAVLAIEPVDARFHARFHAVSKTYVYRIWRAPYPPVFQRRTVWAYDGELDSATMRQMAQLMVGKRDFKAFSTDKTKKSTVRTLTSIDIVESEELMTLTFKGDGFLYNMVRILAGTLLAAGRGEFTPEKLNRAFETGDRSLVGETLPAKGLTLEAVVYDK